jgi:hypothetical protein
MLYRTGAAEMKYFTRKALNENFKRTVNAYQKQLGKLESRISRQAWNFFAFGFGGWDSMTPAFSPFLLVMGCPIQLIGDSDST